MFHEEGLDKDVEPANGGCWFCHRGHGEMSFSCEFDTWLHLDCLKNEIALLGEFENPEAEIMKKEFNL